MLIRPHDSLSMLRRYSKSCRLNIFRNFLPCTSISSCLLYTSGLLTPELEEAKSGDLMIVIKGTSEEANERTLIAIDELFAHKEQGGQHEARYATIASAKKHAPRCV